MTLGDRQLKAIRWTARIAALATLLFGLPFYFGYGNPLPFINPSNRLMDNVWLSAFPLVFAGLALGWRYERTGGYLVVVPIAIAFVLGLILEREGLPWPMSVPLIIGLLYLFVGYRRAA